MPGRKVIFSDGYEYEVERDEKALFSRPKKGDRIRWELGNAASKRRKVEASGKEEDSLLSDVESDQSVASDDEMHIVCI